MRRFLVFAAVLAVPALSMGATPASAQEVVENIEVRKELAREIVDIAYPEAQREAMFMKAVDQIEAQTLQSLRGQFNDDGALEIVEQFQQDFRAEQVDLLRRHIPALMEGWADAYAELFDADELRDILAFVKTDTGRIFMMRSVDVMSNDNFARANQAYMDETMAAAMRRIPQLMESIAAYKESKSSED